MFKYDVVVGTCSTESVRKHERKRQHERPGHRWDDINMDVKVAWTGFSWLRRYTCRAVLHYLQTVNGP
jgi:hypothetical protein